MASSVCQLLIRPDLWSSPYQVHHVRHQLFTHSRPLSPKLGDEEGRREVLGWPVLPPRMAGTTAQAALPLASPAALPPPDASPCQRYYCPTSRGTTAPAVLPPLHGRYYRTCTIPKPERFKVRASAVLPPPAERYYRLPGAVLPDLRDRLHPELLPVVPLRGLAYK